MKVEYQIEISEETDSPRDHFGYNTEEENEAAAQEILDQLCRGNAWAWCLVKLTARVEINGETFEGYDYLGCCSYKSEADFIECNDYYADMKHNALEDLKAKLLAAQTRGALAHDALRSFKS